MKSLFESMNQSFERKFNSLKEGNCSECDDIRFNDDTDYEVDESCDARKARIKEACRGKSLNEDTSDTSVEGWTITIDDNELDKYDRDSSGYSVERFNRGDGSFTTVYGGKFDDAFKVLKSIISKHPKGNQYNIDYSPSVGYSNTIVRAVKNVVPSRALEDKIKSALESEKSVNYVTNAQFDYNKHPGVESILYVNMKDGSEFRVSISRK